MTVAERNRAIKKVLARRFGRKNVRVKGDRGTAYGWVNIYVQVPKPHKGECERPEGWPGSFYECDACKRVREETEKEIWRLLKEAGLYDELGTYYDDMGDKHKEVIIHIFLVEEDEDG